MICFAVLVSMSLPFEPLATISFSAVLPRTTFPDAPLSSPRSSPLAVPFMVLPVMMFPVASDAELTPATIISAPVLFMTTLSRALAMLM
jgi:hypothetical protein